VCSVYRTAPVLSGRGGYVWLARAHAIEIEIEPFTHYEWSVEGSNIRKLTINPGMVLARLPLRLVGQERVRPDAYDTWPQTIRSQVAKIPHTRLDEYL